METVLLKSKTSLVKKLFNQTQQSALKSLKQLILKNENIENAFSALGPVRSGFKKNSVKTQCSK
jgi:type II secretory pathway component PulJ